MVAAGLKETPKYEKLCLEAQEKRESKKEKYVQKAYEMLRRLTDQAESRGLKLGIENREAIEEIPFESDFHFFFREFTNPTVAYWHDTGHAQIKENLGFINHFIHLESLADRLAGFHIHDVEYPDRDHRPPGEGTIDFAALKPLVKPEHIKVFEMSPSLPREKVENGIRHLKSIWGEE
jgi:sugar phosphate isomerase/epimerase